jgi:hypothetical protein
MGALLQSGHLAIRVIAARPFNAGQRSRDREIARFDQPFDSCKSHSAICSRVIR